jgi:L-fuculose-phosphate aldolase
MISHVNAGLIFYQNLAIFNDNFYTCEIRYTPRKKPTEKITSTGVSPTEEANEDCNGAGYHEPNYAKKEPNIKHGGNNTRTALPLKGFLSTNLEPMKDIVTACQKLYERRLVANHDGNITFKRLEGGFIATPTSFSKGDVTESDLLLLDEAGQVIHGRHKVFSEIAMHLNIYRTRPDIKCIVHAHPPTASGFGLAGLEIGTPSIPEAIVSLGRGIFNVKNNSSEELSRVLAESDAFIIPGNGAWTVGQDVMQTYYRMELVEHIAQQHFTALQLVDALKPLSEDQVSALLAKRPKAPSQPAESEKKLKSLVEEEVRTIFSLEE